MTEIIASLAAIAPRYEAVLCDLWGCLHNGVAAYPEAVSALQAVRRGGGKVLLLTNAPRPKASIVAQLDALSVPRDAWDELVTSGDAAQYALISGAVGRRVHHIGPAKDAAFFTEFAPDLQILARNAPPIARVALAEAEGIVCTGLVDDLTETPDDYHHTLLYAKTKGLPMLCANPDLVVDLGAARIFCAGAIAQAYEAMGGLALYFGKPHPPIYDLARRRLAALGVQDGAALLAIGDGINTDIQGGVAEGIDTLFITGGIAASAFGADAAHPDKALLEPWLAAKRLSASFAMGLLR